MKIMQSSIDAEYIVRLGANPDLVTVTGNTKFDQTYTEVTQEEKQSMGDAITIALLSARNFTAQDFAVFHPGGALGRKLLLTVENVMHSGEANPIIHFSHTAKEALFLMTDKGLGATSVVDDQGKFIGLVTDGDIRRSLAKGSEFLDAPVEKLMLLASLLTFGRLSGTSEITAMKSCGISFYRIATPAIILGFFVSLFAMKRNLTGAAHLFS